MSQAFQVQSLSERRLEQKSKSLLVWQDVGGSVGVQMFASGGKERRLVDVYEAEEGRNVEESDWKAR